MFMKIFLNLSCSCVLQLSTPFKVSLFYLFYSDKFQSIFVKYSEAAPTKPSKKELHHNFKDSNIFHTAFHTHVHDKQRALKSESTGIMQTNAFNYIGVHFTTV